MYCNLSANPGWVLLFLWSISLYDYAGSRVSVELSLALYLLVAVLFGCGGREKWGVAVDLKQGPARLAGRCGVYGLYM